MTEPTATSDPASADAISASRARPVRAHRRTFPEYRDYAAAGGRRAAAGAIRDPGDAARGRAADQRHLRGCVYPISGGLGQRDRAPGRRPGGAGAVRDQGRQAHLFGVAARNGRDHGAVQGGRGPHRRHRAPVQQDPLQRRLAAAEPRRRSAHHQTQGHRRRADPDRDAVVQGRSGRRLRTRQGGPRHRAGDQARPGYPRRLHHRRPGAGGARGARPSGPGRPRHRPDRSASRATGQQHDPRRHRRGGGQHRGAGAGRHLPDQPGRDRRAGGRAAWRARRLSARRGTHRTRPRGAADLCLDGHGRRGGDQGGEGWLHAGDGLLDARGDHRGGQAGGHQRGGHRRARGGAHRATARHLHPRGRRGQHHAQLWRDRRLQGQEADHQAGLCDHLGGGAGLARHRLARVDHRRRRGGRHAGADAVRVLGLWLHAQPGVAVRADLLHRHPGGRRHRRGREHPSTHGAVAAQAAAATDAGRGG